VTETQTSSSTKPIPDSGPQRKRFDRIAPIACLVLCLSAYSHLCHEFWFFTVDDAYITARQARNLVDGYGFVYNEGGPKVEAFTHPSVFLIEVLAVLLGGRPVWITAYLGVLSGAVLILGSWFFSRDLIRWTLEDSHRVSPVAAFAGPSLLALSPILVAGSVSGLETSTFAALLTWAGWGFLRLLHQEGAWKMAVLTGILMGTLVWTRPEGAAWLIGFSVATLALARRKKQPLRDLLTAAGLAFGFWILLLALRLVIFGRLQPNTYYAKVAGSLEDRIIPGLWYVREWVVGNGGWLAISLGLLAVFLTPPRRRATVLITVCAVIGGMGIVIWEGGDWIPYLRLMAPILGFAAVLVSVGLAVIAARFAGAHARWISAASVVFLVIAFSTLSAKQYKRAQNEAFTRTLGWQDAHVPLGEWLQAWGEERKAKGSPPLTVAIDDIGLVGYISKANIIDLAGLADPDWAKRIHQAGGQSPYPAGRLVLEKKPEAIVLISFTGHRSRDLRFNWKTDEQIYRHPAFSDLYKEKVMFTHKDFPGDGYFLHVFLRNDVFEEAPDVTPPPARATGW